ncbi:DUF58 domain-containing protein [Luedemannella helvata]|uniref:DUF58 domain-containing protein n=1 Tax=Luedemannella helvata TaxID=349315 RepID=A0ABN2KFU3_9ACTN
MRRFTATGSGIGLAAGAVACYGLGVLLGYPVLVAIAVGAFAVLACALVAVAVRPSVTLTRRVTPARLTVGEIATGEVEVRNTVRWPSPAFTAIDQIGAGELVELAVSPLAGHGRRTVRYEVPARRRGRLRLGPMTVLRRDPFGLLAWRQRQTADGVLWVHPRVHPLQPLPVGVVLDYEGRANDQARLGTVTFSSLRDYVPGDDPRQIHWKTTARLGTLVVREHVDTMEPTTTVVLDARADAFSSAQFFEYAVELAASVVRAVESVGRPVTLRVVGEQADGGAESTMDRLALAEPTPDPDPLRLLSVIERAPGGGVLVAVTGPIDAGLLGRLAEQRRRYAPVVVVALGGSSTTGSVARRPGMAIIDAPNAVEAAFAWNRLVRGETAS